MASPLPGPRVGGRVLLHAFQGRIDVRCKVASVLVQVASKTGGRVREELVVTDLEGEIDSGQVSLGIPKADLILEPNHDREAASGIVAGFAHVWAHIGSAGVAGFHLDEDLISRDAHYKRA